jgi:hypothetical protein
MKNSEKTKEQLLNDLQQSELKISEPIKRKQKPIRRK